jgi:hypothetical protein
MKPIPIDEAEETERIQLLKQRESLIKGMGITEFVHRILFGTAGECSIMACADRDGKWLKVNRIEHK